MAQERSKVPLMDEFTEREWIYYDSYEAETKAQLPFQRHVDLRTFLAESKEGWTTGTFGYLPVVNSFPALSVTAENTVETESITPKHPVDLLTGFSDTDYLTFALPKFPLESINVSQSRIEITSDPLGHCSNKKLTAVVNFSESIKSIMEGNSQFLVKRSTLKQNEINLGSITGVRFKIVCNSGKTGTVYLMGLKLILASAEGDPGWVVSTIDFDNWNGILRKPSPLNGDITSGPVLDQGIVWRSDILPGINDPKPVDTEYGIVINPGSQSKQNEITLYLRQEPFIFQTQLDLIGMVQSQLDGRPQPDLGIEEFSSRTVGEFDSQSMAQLDHLETMKDLERLPVANPIEQSWVSFSFQWGEGKSKLIMNNSLSEGYTFSKMPAMNNNQEYLLVYLLEDSNARVRLFALNKDKSVVQEPIFDSTLINDDGVFRRRQGRVGWKAVLADNDAYVQSIRPRNTVFAEYRSTPLTSFTPVSGASLFASFSGNEELWTHKFSVYPEGSENVTIAEDSVRTLDLNELPEEGDSDNISFRVQTNGTENVGIQTDFMNFTNFNQAEIQFGIWFNGMARDVGNRKISRPRNYAELEKLGMPNYGQLESLFSTYESLEAIVEVEEETLESNIIAQLESDEGTILSLGMPELETNQWQKVTLRIPEELIIQTGNWRLQLIQPTKTASTWWVDGVFIFERSVQWSARSVVDDPWKSNYAPWTDFHEIVNTNKKGIILSPRGNDLQLRARALHQNATIKTPKLVPHYAKLGRLVWPEEKLTNKISPTANFLIEPLAAREFKFIDESKSGTGSIVGREWDFGDGELFAGNNTEITHRYTQPGTYYVTLVIMDRNGLLSQITEAVEVF